jgi:hypothetical protein
VPTAAAAPLALGQAASPAGPAEPPGTPSQAPSGPNPPGEESPPGEEPRPEEPPSEENPAPRQRLVGNPDIQTNADIDHAGSAEAFLYVARTSGTVTSLSLYVATGTSASSIVVGLYGGGGGGRPGTLLTSAVIASPAPGAWNMVSVSPVAVTAGSVYWLAALPREGSLALRDLADGGAPAQESQSSSLSSLPASWVSGESFKNSPASFYAAGEAEGSPPTASFSYSPAAPVTGEAVEFDGSGSFCPAGPCTYEWSDDGSPTRPIPPLFPYGEGQTISLTFASAGTKYMRLVVTDVLGETATVEHDVTVGAESHEEEPPPAAPRNTSAPTVTGTAEVGQTLTAHKGSWSGTAPIAYSYQWQRGTADIAGATGAGYTPVAADVGHTLDVVVTASNTAGMASAKSAATAAVTEPAPPNEEGGHQTNCIGKPSACGYPDATNTGVPAGTALTAKTGDMHVSSPGTTIKDIALDGTIDVEADNTTIEASEIIVNGTQAGCNSPCGGKGIWTKPGVTGTVVKDVTCHGGAPTGANVTEFCIQSNSSTTKATRVHYYNCTTCMVGPGEWTDSFVDQTGATIPQEHYEDIYYGGGGGPLVVNHDTMLNPQGQTAVVFASVDFGNQTTLTITNNLMAGGGFVIYGGGSGSGGKVLGPVTITGNRFSRKYYPKGGYYGTNSYMNYAVTTWANNIWDDTLKPVEEE